MIRAGVRFDSLRDERFGFVDFGGENEGGLIWSGWNFNLSLFGF